MRYFYFLTCKNSQFFRQSNLLLFWSYFQNYIGDAESQRHIAAITLLIAFVQLYLLLVRVVPNTPIPVYINMFITVLKTYTFILLCYMAFIIAFSYSFFIIFSDHEINGISR